MQCGPRTARQRFGVLQPSGAFRRTVHARKRRRSGALQDAHASLQPLVLANLLRTLLRLHEYGLLVVDPIIMGEIWEGIVRLPEGKRKQNLIEWYGQSRAGIICLPWTLEIGVVWGELSCEVTRNGFTISAEDTMIAATAKLHGLTVATRTVDVFTRCGVPVANPFE